MLVQHAKGFREGIALLTYP